MAHFVVILWHFCTTSIRTGAPTTADPACAGFRLNGIFSRSPHPPRPRSTAAPPSSLCHHQSEPRVFATFERSTRRGSGAGEGNRTFVISLGSCHFVIE